MATHPPKPRLALSVGVVGHRPNRLPFASHEKITAEVRYVLNRLAAEAENAHKVYKDLFTPDPPQLALVTALAEGADRIVAEGALAEGFTLSALLPFPTETYKASFEGPDSHDKFHRLLERAESVFTLPGQPDDEARTYETLGVHLLSVADILITVWDGGPSEGKGGTTEVLELAMQLGIPIIHVDANSEAVTRIIWNDFVEFPRPIDSFKDHPSSDIATTLPKIIDNLIRAPASPSDRNSIIGYFSEKKFLCNFRLEFPLLMASLGIRSIRRTDVFPIDPTTLAANFAALASRVNSDDISHLASAYGWADAIGVRVAQVFRSAFVSNFLIAAIAVVLAVMSPMFPHQKLLFVAIEIGLVAFVIANTTTGRKFRWHQRWLEAREVTERLRVALVFWVLGLRPPILFSGREPTWIGWYARAVIRSQGLRSGELNAQGLANALLVIDALLKEQCRFHEKNRHLMHRLENQLERLGLTLFAFTICASALFFAFSLATSYHEIPMATQTHMFINHLVVAITAGLPALATAIYGIRTIGDFEGIARRSERTHTVLTRLITLLELDAIELNVLRARARSAANIMLGDVETWRVSAESRTLAIPG